MNSLARMHVAQRQVSNWLGAACTCIASNGLLMGPHSATTTRLPEAPSPSLSVGLGHGSHHGPRPRGAPPPEPLHHPIRDEGEASRLCAVKRKKSAREYARCLPAAHASELVICVGGKAWPHYQPPKIHKIHPLADLEAADPGIYSAGCHWLLGLGDILISTCCGDGGREVAGGDLGGGGGTSPPPCETVTLLARSLPGIVLSDNFAF